MRFAVRILILTAWLSLIAYCFVVDLRGALIGTVIAAVEIAAGVKTWLGTLNFLVLQWFGIRLVRVYAQQIDEGPVINAFVVLGGGVSVERSARVGQTVAIGWRWMRWIWPLTGWRTDFRYIARRP